MSGDREKACHNQQFGKGGYDGKKTDSPNSGTKILVVISTSFLHHTFYARLFFKIEGLLDQRLLIDSI